MQASGNDCDVTIVTNTITENKRGFIFKRRGNGGEEVATKILLCWWNDWIEDLILNQRNPARMLYYQSRNNISRGWILVRRPKRSCIRSQDIGVQTLNVRYK